MSKLIPDSMLAKLPNLYDTEKDDKNTCFGYVIGHEAELGSKKTMI